MEKTIRAGRVLLSQRQCKAHRALRGFSGQKLAQILGMPYQTWFMYESASRGTPKAVLRAAAKALRCRQADLLP